MRFVFPVEVVVSGFRQNANLCIHRPSSKEAANWMQDTDPRTLFDPLHFMCWVCCCGGWGERSKCRERNRKKANENSKPLSLFIQDSKTTIWRRQTTFPKGVFTQKQPCEPFGHKKAHLIASHRHTSALTTVSKGNLQEAFQKDRKGKDVSWHWR